MAIEKLVTEQFNRTISADQAQKKQININSIMGYKVYTLDSINSVNIGSIFYKIIYTGAPKAGESVLYTRDTDWSTYLTFAISDTNVAAGNILTFNATYGKSLRLVEYINYIVTDIMLDSNVILQPKVYQLPDGESSNDWYTIQIINNPASTATPPTPSSLPGSLHIEKGWVGSYSITQCNKICTKFIVPLAKSIYDSASMIYLYATKFDSTKKKYTNVRGFTASMQPSTGKIRLDYNQQGVAKTEYINWSTDYWIGLEFKQIASGSQIEGHMISNIPNLQDIVLFLGFVGDRLDVYNFDFELNCMDTEFNVSTDILIQPYVIDQYPLIIGN